VNAREELRGVSGPAYCCCGVRDHIWVADVGGVVVQLEKKNLVRPRVAASLSSGRGKNGGGNGLTCVEFDRSPG